MLLAACLAGSAWATAIQRPLRPNTDWKSPPQHVVSLQDEELLALVERYAPIIKLSGLEAYFPSSIEYMLPHYAYVEDEHGSEEPANHTQLTPAQLDSLPRSGAGLYLSLAEAHNPQPFLDEESEYLYGPAGQEQQVMQLGEDDRGRVEEPVYAFWVDQGRGIVDIWYWTFYPFNFGKPVGPFGVLGNHVADWERFTVRTINGTPVSADYNSHTGGRFAAGTSRWVDVPLIDDRPVAYAAAGSHGIWPSPGDHVYANVLNFKLVDVTDDLGPIWDSRTMLMPFKYWSGPQRRERMQHNGSASWLNFRGWWGNKGEHDCWWHRMVPICQLVDAPPGPNRFFGGPPACTIAPLAWEQSTYSFYLSAQAARWAESRSVAVVQVEQICVRPQSNGDDDDDEIMDYEQYDYEEGMEVWTIGGATPFKGEEQHIVSTLPCKGTKSAVKAYRLSLCLGNGKCLTTSPERKVCSYEEGKLGYRVGNAVNVDDLDDWRWVR